MACQHKAFKKHGRNSTGKQRFRCKDCGQAWLESKPEPLGTMRTSLKDATTVLGMLLEGLSIRAVSRLTGIHYDTIGDMILSVGANCEELMDSIRNVAVNDVEIDEIWSFVGCKEKVAQARGYSDDQGDSWTFLGIERESKLVLAFEIGARDEETAGTFLSKVNRATVGRFQVSTDGLGVYTNGVPFAFGNRVDFAQLIKDYQSSQTETRYSPAKIISCEKKTVFGNPDKDRICTSHIESFNQKYRMHLRRFTRLTNAHSKSLKHHRAMQAIYLCYYNWCRKHDTLKTTPAISARISDHQWNLQELLEKAAERNYAATN
jgi:transposase-like protein/IS1 family transposase